MSKALFWVGWLAFVIAALILQPAHPFLPFYVRLAIGGVFLMAWAGRAK